MRPMLWLTSGSETTTGAAGPRTISRNLIVSAAARATLRLRTSARRSYTGLPSPSPGTRFRHIHSDTPRQPLRCFRFISEKDALRHYSQDLLSPASQWKRMPWSAQNRGHPHRSLIWRVELSGREPVEHRASEPVGCVSDMLLESTCVARFAAENLFPFGPSSDGGKPCEPRIGPPSGRGSTRTSARLGTVVSAACMVALSRSKPCHTKHLIPIS